MAFFSTKDLVFEIFDGAVGFPLPGNPEWSSWPIRSYGSIDYKSHISPEYELENGEFSCRVSVDLDGFQSFIFINCCLPGWYLFCRNNKVVVDFHFYQANGKHIITHKTNWDTLYSIGCSHRFPENLAKTDYYVKIIITSDAPFEVDNTDSY